MIVIETNLRLCDSPCIATNNIPFGFAPEMGHLLLDATSRRDVCSVKISVGEPPVRQPHEWRSQVPEGPSMQEYVVQIDHGTAMIDLRGL